MGSCTNGRCDSSSWSTRPWDKPSLFKYLHSLTVQVAPANMTKSCFARDGSEARLIQRHNQSEPRGRVLCMPLLRGSLKRGQ